MFLVDSRTVRLLLLVPLMLTACVTKDQSVDPAITITTAPTMMADQNYAAPGYWGANLGYVYQTQTFSAACSGGSGPLSTSWDFGDGTSSASPTHVYTQPGPPARTLSDQTPLSNYQYVVTFSCSDSAGQLVTARFFPTIIPTFSFLNCVSIQTTPKGWCWQYPYPYANDLVDISAISNNVGWAVSDLGDIFGLSFGGNLRYSTQSLGWNTDSAHRVNSITTIDINTAWAAGGDTVLKTIDGGSNWNAVSYANTPHSSNYPSPTTIISLNAIDAQNAWLLTHTASGTNYAVLRTSNGGLSWTYQLWVPTDAPAAMTARDVVNAWIACTDGAVYHSGDGGASFQRQAQLTDSNSAPVALTAIRARKDNGMIWVAGDNSNVWRSTDGGMTWPHVSTSLAKVAPNISKISLSVTDTSSANPHTSLDSAYLVGTQNDPTTNITQLPLPASGLVSQTPELSVGYYTNDGGNTWTPVITTPLSVQSGSSSNPVQYNDQYDLRAVSSYDSGSAYAVGNNGNSVLLTGAGLTPSSNSYKRDTLYAISAIDPLNAWAVAGSGVILATANGGGSWTLQNDPENADATVPKVFGYLTAVSAVDSQTVWVAGPASATPHSGWHLYSPNSTQPTLYLTTDGGQHWISPSGKVPPGDIYGISGIDQKNAWAVGQDSSGNAMVINTLDGGNNWTASIGLPAGTGPLTAVRVLSAGTTQTIWAIGMSDTVLIGTVNGANVTWNLTHTGLGASANLTSIALLSDGKTAWVTSANGNIEFTSTGGAAWASQTSTTTQYLSQISAADANHAWAVGAAKPGSGQTSVILSTTNGGATWVQQPSGTTQMLFGVQAVNPTTAWVVGSGGAILRTETGGN